MNLVSPSSADIDLRPDAWRGDIDLRPASGGGSGYSYYRWVITEGGDVNWVGTEELQLYATEGGGNIVNTSGAVTKVGQSGAFDDDFTTRLAQPVGDLPITVSVQFTDAPVSVVQYGVSPYGLGDPSRNIRTWTFEASNNGTDWTTLDTVTNYNWIAEGESTTATNRFTLA